MPRQASKFRQPLVLEAVVDEPVDGFLGVARALLDAPNQFVFLPFLIAEIVIGQLTVLLFEFAFGDIPIAFDMK
jgi:hypothetical protein